MTINATLINLFHVCRRECWLHANGIRMEHTSDIVYDGKLLHETSYPQRPERGSEMDLGAEIAGVRLSGKIDFYDSSKKIIHEIKRSDKMERAHEWQIKFYIWLLALNGIEGVQAILEYPKLRETKAIQLGEADRKYLKEIVEAVRQMITSESCPVKIKIPPCKSCSYYDLCYIDE